MSNQNASDPKLIFSLLKLAELGALYTWIRASTIELARELGVSQQTASRYVIELEKRGAIERQLSLQGSQIRLTEKGRQKLETLYHQLRGVLEEQPPILSFEGTVVSGLGEGAYYVSMKGYKQQFLKKLGFEPFPGTLNLRLTPDYLGVKKELEAYPAIIIEGFTQRGRTFGRVKCFHAVINNDVEGAVALINRTHHDDRVIELIAPSNLRTIFDLSEGSTVVVHVQIR